MVLAISNFAQAGGDEPPIETRKALLIPVLILKIGNPLVLSISIIVDPPAFINNLSSRISSNSAKSSV